MASTAVFFVLIITMGQLTRSGSAGGSAGGEGELTTPGSAGGSGGELMPPGSAGGSAGGEGKLTTPGSAGGSAGGEGKLTTPGSLRQELALLHLGSDCSVDCMQCLLESIGSCLVDAMICVDPLAMGKCFGGKFIIIEDCFGTGELTTPGSAGGGGTGGEAELTAPGSAGGTASELMPGSAGGSATTTADVSALLRQELALLDLGSNCSDDCMQCLLDSIGSCLVDAMICVILGASSSASSTSSLLLRNVSAPSEPN